MLKNHKFSNTSLFAFVIGILIVQYYMLEIGTNKNIYSIIIVKPIYQAAGVLIILTVNVILLFIVKNLKVSMLISLVIIAIISLVNHYVTLLHGTPFNVLLIKNAGTALNVLTNYSIEIDMQVACILLLFVIQFVVIYTLFTKIHFKRKISLSILVVLRYAVFMFYGSSNAIIPRNAVSWSWKNSINIYGYTPCFVSNWLQNISVPSKPEGYNEKEVSDFVNKHSSTIEGTNTPDVIFILNESFYDLNQIMDINTDVDYMEYINSLGNAITGYAVVPGAGGGTNRSEYEFLTSNSLAMNIDITPFNDLDINGTNSVVSYLKAKGYSTLGSHPYSSRNYRRNSAYFGLGFDYVYFDSDFTEMEYYNNRHYVTDKSVYENLLKWYEEMPEGPRFLYVLTIQNHAAYNHDEAEHDIVHTKNDYGEKTEEINEYLTSVYLSNTAFETLVEYYENVDRDVIICMVGDHAPAFAKDYIDDNYSDEEAELRIRSTPYIIWSNNIDLSEMQGAYERIGINYLAPTVIELAGMDLSGYYVYLKDMRYNIPVITSYGSYITNNGQSHKFADITKYSEKIDLYFDLSYANMKNELFMEKYCK